MVFLFLFVILNGYPLVILNGYPLVILNGYPLVILNEVKDLFTSR